MTPPKTTDPVAGVPNFFDKDRRLTYRRCAIFDNAAEDILGVLEGCVAFIEQAKFYGRRRSMARMYGEQRADDAQADRSPLVSCSRDRPHPRALQQRREQIALGRHRVPDQGRGHELRRRDALSSGQAPGGMQSRALLLASELTTLARGRSSPMRASADSCSSTRGGCVDQTRPSSELLEDQLDRRSRHPSPLHNKERARHRARMMGHLLARS